MCSPSIHPYITYCCIVHTYIHTAACHHCSLPLLKSRLKCGLQHHRSHPRLHVCLHSLLITLCLNSLPPYSLFLGWNFLENYLAELSPNPPFVTRLDCGEHPSASLFELWTSIRFELWTSIHFFVPLNSILRRTSTALIEQLSHICVTLIWLMGHLSHSHFPCLQRTEGRGQTNLKRFKGLWR